MVLLIAIAATPLACLLMYNHPRIGWAASVVGFVIPLSQVEVPLDTRFIVVPALLLQLLALSKSRTPSRRMNYLASPVVWALSVLVTLFLLSSLWSTDPRGTAVAAGAWVILLAGILVFLRALPPDTLVNDAFRIGYLVLVVSLGVALARLPFAYAGERAVGVMTNANGLGVLCALIAPWLLRHGLSVRAIVMVFAPIILIVLSGSRAGALGVFAGLVVLALGVATAKWRVIIAPVAFASGWAISTLDFSRLSGSTMLLRTNNSRAELWRAVLVEFSENPFVGSGFGTLDLIGGSSYLKVAAEMGVIGIVSLGVCLTAAIVGARHSYVALGILAAGMTNAIFESWLVAAGSMYALLFFAVALAAALARKEEGHDSMVGKQADSAVL